MAHFSSGERNPNPVKCRFCVLGNYPSEMMQGIQTLSGERRLKNFLTRPTLKGTQMQVSPAFYLKQENVSVGCSQVICSALKKKSGKRNYIGTL